MRRNRADQHFLARWSRWWPVRPDEHFQQVRCCDCHTAGRGTGETLHVAGWHGDRAGSYLCPSCAFKWREAA